VAPILDFRVSLTSIPPFFSTYSSARTGCVHRIVVTLKVKDSQSNYEDFTGLLRSIISKSQWKSFENVFSSFMCFVLLMVLISAGRRKLSVFGNRDVLFRKSLEDITFLFC